MVDWLDLWGLTQETGFVFKPVLKVLAENAEHDPDEQVREFAREKLEELQGLGLQRIKSE